MATKGLKVASAGQTLRLPIAESEHQAAVQALNLIRKISLLQPCFKTMDHAMQILQGAKITEFSEGDIIVSKTDKVSMYNIFV